MKIVFLRSCCHPLEEYKRWKKIHWKSSWIIFTSRNENGNMCTCISHFDAQKQIRWPSRVLFESIDCFWFSIFIGLPPILVMLDATVFGCEWNSVGMLKKNLCFGVHFSGEDKSTPSAEANASRSIFFISNCWYKLMSLCRGASLKLKAHPSVFRCARLRVPVSSTNTCLGGNPVKNCHHSSWKDLSSAPVYLLSNPCHD